MWNDKNIFNTNFNMLEHGANNLHYLNPDWQFIVHTNEEIDETIQNFKHAFIPPSMKSDLLNAHIVEKSDAKDDINSTCCVLIMCVI